ncbi:hypothetical protein EX30DRAFT_340443 [Ascodesmis nigricans]|uniref:Uncharacterized protein n=1 Tax=Ascodesmis nigricans TaxID=341454 RepID=A0A4S2MY03_9PEZI|nr:hypothetical protein EX30DRAFT_340443 [Ascodesmis nigricans]
MCFGRKSKPETVDNNGPTPAPTDPQAEPKPAPAKTENRMSISSVLKALVGRKGSARHASVPPPETRSQVSTVTLPMSPALGETS